MSIETRTLDDFQEEEKEADEDAGAAYGRPETYREETPEDAGCCRSCGTPVEQEATRPSEIQRVFADQHGRVLAGPCCQDPQTYAKAIQGVKGTTERAREITAVEAHRREGADL